MCQSGPLTAAKPTVWISGSVSGGTAARLTLRNYTCTKLCPAVMEISPDGPKNTFIRLRSWLTQDDSGGRNEVHTHVYSPCWCLVFGMQCLQLCVCVCVQIYQSKQSSSPRCQRSLTITGRAAYRAPGSLLHITETGWKVWEEREAKLKTGTQI